MKNEESNEEEKLEKEESSNIGKKMEKPRSLEVQPRFVTSLPGFRRLSTTGDGILQIAPTETRPIG